MTNVNTELDTRQEINEILNFLSESDDVSGAASEIMAIIDQDYISKASVEQIIGIDELEFSPDGGKRYEARMIRNKLRNKQRQRAGLSEEGKKE